MASSPARGSHDRRLGSPGEGQPDPRLQLDRAPLRASGNLRDARRQFERDYIASVLRAHEWQMRDAARALGIERANLYRKARQLGIPLRRDGDAGAHGVTR